MSVGGRRSAVIVGLVVAASLIAGPGVEAASGLTGQPPPITDLTATPGIYSAKLSWARSADPLTTTLVCRGTGAINKTLPDPTTCTPLYDGIGSTLTVAATPYWNTFFLWAEDPDGTLSDPQSVTVDNPGMGSLAVSAVAPPTASNGQRFEIVADEVGAGGLPTGSTATYTLYARPATGGDIRLQTVTALAVAGRFFLNVATATTYFVVAEPSATLAGSVSRTIVAVPQRLIVLHKAKPVQIGRRRTITGRVFPKVGVARITIYSWTPAGMLGAIFAHPNVGPDGRFKFTVAPARKGRHWFVAATAGSNNYEASLSNVDPLTALPAKRR